MDKKANPTHTPGPRKVEPRDKWHLPTDDEDGAIFVDTGEEGILVPIYADPDYAGEALARAHANAALIAAAPELLGALEAVIPYMEELLQLKKYHIKNDVHAHIVFRDAVAVIIKAEGRV
jgi:hypothetical protein